jgi:DNA polymerase III alpha subunit
MAILLSIIRPGKAKLQGKTWKEVSEDVWNKPEDGAYYFKKAHAVAYAHLVAVHINLLCEEYK